MVDSVAGELARQGFSLIETHISHVLLRGDDVYKIKRPVDLGFLSFGTLRQREAACEAEVVLNRRLAPSVYRGVVAMVRGGDGQLQALPRSELHGQEVIEWAVHMHRLPDQARLDVCLARGDLARPELVQLAALLVQFHGRARCDEHTSSFGAPTRIAGNVEENFAQTRELWRDHLAFEELQQLVRYQRRFLHEQAGLFEARALGGFVRDGHGDLRLEHVYRAAGGQHVIIDCIEFNERFRFADVCADLAFLTMDLKSQGHPELAEQLAAEYAKHSDDYGLYRLLDFYESYRAFVRGKVSSMLAHDSEVSAPARERAREAARRYFLLALSSADPPLRPVQLVVCMGLIASGKSTIAEGLAEQLAAPVLSADWTRKKLLSAQPEQRLSEQPFQGAYGSKTSAQVYARLAARAELLLRSGRSVVVDATFRSEAQRRAMLELARACSARVLFVECQCPREVAMQRLRARAELPHVSDGRAEIYDAFAASFAPTDTLPREAHLRVDTRAPVFEVLARAQAELA